MPSGFDPMGAYRFFEKIMPHQRSSPRSAGHAPAMKSESRECRPAADSKQSCLFLIALGEDDA
jgi:hypothetical protein